MPAACLALASSGSKWAHPLGQVAEGDALVCLVDKHMANSQVHVDEEPDAVVVTKRRSACPPVSLLVVALGALEGADRVPPQQPHTLYITAFHAPRTGRAT